MLNESQRKTELAHKQPTIRYLMILGVFSLITVAYFIFQLETNSQRDLENGVVINNQVIETIIADEPTEWTQGLSDRERLRENQGMLFIFPESRIPSFWMKDMNFSIDIIWINQNNKIIGIEKSVRPETYPQTFRPDEPIMYVLEVSAGYTDKHQIATGNNVDINLSSPLK